MITPRAARTLGTGLATLGAVTVLAGWGTSWTVPGAIAACFGLVLTWRAGIG